MKVLFISRRFYPDVIGGGEISALHIAKAVKNQGHDVYVCTFTDKKTARKEFVEGIKIFRIPIRKLSLFPKLSNMDYMFYRIAKSAIKMVEEIQPDIVHLLNFDSVPITPIFLKKRFRLPIVATVNGPIFGCFTGEGIDYKGDFCRCDVKTRFMNSIKKWGSVRGFAYFTYSLWYMNMLKYSYRYVDRFFLVSDAMNPLMKNMAVPNEKMTKIHNPIEPKQKSPSKVKEKLGIKGKKMIVYAGRLAENKGIQNTILAMKNVDDAVFVILGEKRNYYNKLKALVKKNGLEEKVIFTGFIEQENIGEYYSSADGAVLVESFYEPLSRFLLEAMSYGLPIIANDIGGNTEIVEDGKNGYLIRGSSPKLIAEKLNNLHKLKNVKEKSAGKIKKEFSEQIVGKKLVMKYHDLIDKSPK